MINKKLKDENTLFKSVKGFSLVELVVAMGILMIFMPVVIGLMDTSLKARESANINTQNTMNARTIDLLLKKDIKTAVAMKASEDGNSLLIATKEDATAADYDGLKCKEWVIDEDGLKKVVDNGPTKDLAADKWTIIYDMVNQNDSTPAFSYNNDGNLEYSLKLGRDNNTTVVNGLITPTIASGSQGACWA